MINDRLFKKINSIFWGIISWFPIFLFLFMVVSYSFTLDYNTLEPGFNFETFFNECLNYASTNYGSYFNLESFFTGSAFYFLSLFTNLSSGIPVFATILIFQVNWYLFVQLVRLLVYVFMWFINFIFDLFDYLSLHRKGDN